MAKKLKVKKEKVTKSEKAEEFKYGVDDLAKALDIQPASARVALRNHGIEKAGKSYGWNSQKEMDEVVKKLQSNKSNDTKKPKKKAKAA